MPSSKGKPVISLDNFEEADAPINSPRSLHALTVCGYVAADITIRPLETFLNKKVADVELRKNLAQVKYEHIEAKRQERLAVVRGERDKMVALDEAKAQQQGQRPISAPESMMESKASFAAAAAASNSNCPAAGAGAEAAAVDPVTANMLKLEEERFQRMRAKQEREMKAIIDFETNLVQKKLEHEKKIEQDMQRLAKRNAEKRARERQLIIKKREIQLRKKREADEERARMRERLKVEHEQEKEEAAAIQKEKEAIEMERRRRYQKALQEKLDREEKKRNDELAHAKALNDKLDEMEADAVARKKKLIERKAEEAALIKEKQARANLRIKEALERDAENQQKIKNDFYKKQNDVLKRKMDRKKEEDAALKKHQENLAKKAQQRRNKYREAMGKKAERIRTFVEHSEEQDARLQAMTKKQKEQRMLQNTRRKLELEDRANNVERNARLQEYKRLKLLEKIEAENARQKALQKAKEDLMERRRRTAKEVLQQKHELADAMLELQITKKFKDPKKAAKKKKPRSTRKVVTRRGKNKPQTRATTVDDEFDFEEMFSTNFYAS